MSPAFTAYVLVEPAGDQELLCAKRSAMRVHSAGIMLGCGRRQAPGFDRDTYKQRNTVERCINRLKRWRGIAIRYEKTATIYLAGLHITGIFLRSAR